MRRFLASRRALLLLLTPLLLARSAAAQYPPASGRDWYEETVQLGFRFRPPKDWKFFPAEFGARNVLGRYLPDRNAVLSAEEPGTFRPILWLLEFEASPDAADDTPGEPQDPRAPLPDLPTWLTAHLGELGASVPLRHCVELERDPFPMKDFAESTEVLFCASEREVDPQYRLHVWTATYALDDARRVSLVASAPSDRRDWAKWRTSLRKLARTFARAEVAEVDTSAVEGGGVRARRHRELLAEVQSNPGWELTVTPHYFLVSNSQDREFVKEVERRIEAIRAQFELEFPAELALRAAEVRKAQEARGQTDVEAPTAVAEDDPLELSRCSVVRVCDSREDYRKYGGPPNSAGYWWSASQELVLFDDQQIGGRRNTWETLNHEAFHQFIFYFLGNLAPGIWFNEGHADYYAGYELSRRGAYEVGRRESRNSILKAELREGQTVPLDVLVRANRAQYYGQAPLQGTVRSRYPQGWSFVYFLRTARPGRVKGWDPEWGTLLQRYLDALIETRDAERATELTFEGIDWVALEACWREGIEHGK